MQTDKPQSHTQRAHALLSASGSKRWLNCTPSARLEEEYGHSSTSAYAAEGTLAHELSELFIRRDVLANISDEQFDERLEAIVNSEHYSEDMPDNIAPYIDYVTQQYAFIKGVPGASLKLEVTVDLTDYVPESFGSVDCAIINDNTLEIIDLKYGKGIPVYAEWNTQLMLYSLGLIDEAILLFGVDTVRLTIVQPRIDNISSWEISARDLLDWAHNDLKPTAKKAFAGEGDLNSGDWCRFCGVKNRCRKLYEKQIEIAQYEFKAPNLLTDEEVADVLNRAPALVEWANGIKDYAQNEAINNNKVWPGFKLVRGRSVRKIADPDAFVAEIRERAPFLGDDDLFEKKLVGITTLEKRLGGKKAFEVYAGDLVVKPEGAPTLVPMDDKRPAIGVDEAINEFANI